MGYDKFRARGQGVDVERESMAVSLAILIPMRFPLPSLGRGDDTVGNPHRAQIYKFELFELILLLKVNKQFSIEQFETTVSQSTVSSPLLFSKHSGRCLPQ